MKTIAREIEEFRAMKVADLLKRYRKLYGKEPRIKNREWQWKRCAYQLQVVRYGGLSVAAQRRLETLVSEINLPLEENQRAVTGQLRGPHTPGNPAVGTTLVRMWKGQEIQVKVLEEGYEWNDVVYRSLSAVARAITGSHWNGRLFFQLTSRKRK